MTRPRAAVVVLALVAAVLAIVVTASPASATTFSNTAAIGVADGKVCLNCTDPGVGSPYPSPITISGMSGTVTAVSVTLKNVSHTYAQDLDFLLVGPGGQKLVILSDVGNAAASNSTVTLSDAAASSMPATGAWASGTYRPTDRASGPADVWPSPAPAGPYDDPAPAGSATFASVFGGTSPNGSWNLYVVDDSLGDTGSVAGGWSLDVTTAALSSTTTTVSSSDNPAQTGDAVSLTATVTTGGSPVTSGTVTFTNNGAPMTTLAVDASGQATVSTAALSEGSHTIKATYNGDATRAPSSGTLEQVVDNPTTRSGDAFCNAGNIQISDANGGPTAGYPYPSHITTSGLPDVVGTVKVTLDGVTHRYADDIDVLLVGPDGQRMVVVSDAGGPTQLSSATTTFRDDAASALSTSGGWSAASRPVDHGTGDSFPASAPPTFAEPAPAGSATFASVFGGTSPNGTWSLYVVDDSLGETGNVTGGWCLDVTTKVPVDARDDSYATAKNTTLTVPAPGVLGNDTPASVSAVPIGGGTTTTQGGTVTLAAGGGFTYTPAAGFTGDDTFSYSATDGVDTDPATVTVHVSNAPTVVGQTVTRRQGAAPSSSTVATVDDIETAPSALTVTLGAVPAGLTVTGVTNTAGTVTADVSVSCTAATGNTAVPLTVTDGDGYTSDGSFTVDVVANTAPTLSYTSVDRAAGDASTVDSSSGPSDDGGAPALSIVAAQTTYPGAVSVAPDGRVSLPAAPVGDYVVEVRAVDGCGVATVADFAVHVTSKPVIVGQTVTRRQGAAPSPSTVATVNDAETAPGALTVSLGTVPSGLTVTGLTNTAGAVTANVSASCTAPTGNRSVPLSVTDGDGYSTDGTFTVNVVANGAPTLAYANVNRVAGQASTVSASSGPSDDGGAPTLSIVAAQTTYPGAVSVAPDGRVSLPAAPAGGYAVRVRAVDTCGTTTVADFTVQVSNPPSLVGTSLTRRQGGGPSSSTIATVDDVETAPGALTVALGPVPPGLTVTGATNTAGTVTAQVSASCTAATGTRTVPITVTDGDGYSTDGSFTVDVVANSAPTLAYTDVNRTSGHASTVDPSIGPADDGGLPTLSIVPAQTTYPGAVTVAPDGRVSLPAAPLGDYTVRVRAVDGCGIATDADFAVHVLHGNTAPTADAGGPYTVAEGAPLDLDGTGSTDPENDSLTYRWDLDGDGQFDDATGAKPHLSWSELEALGIDDGPASLHVVLQVSDSLLTDEDTAALQVTNTPPQASGPATATGHNGVPLTLALTASDPSPADAAALTWHVDWGDGSSDSSLTHTYAGVGTFAVTAVASDKDAGASDPVHVSVSISGATRANNPCGPGSVVLIQGTDQADDIHVKRGPGGAVTVAGLGAPQTFTGVSAVRVHGLGGDDKIVIAPKRPLNRVVYGGAGDDVIVAGQGADMLVGGDGNDTLKGSKGRDVLIGGDGADDARGGTDSDLLVAGSTDFDTTDVPLCQISKAWRVAAPYDDRVAGLSDPTASPSLVPGTTVHDDTDVDRLTGGAGTDWFLYNRTGAGARDVTDRVGGETASDL